MLKGKELLIEKTTFDIRLIEAGHLAIVKDYSHNTVAAGIITYVTPLLLRINHYSDPSTEHWEAVDNIAELAIEIDQVVNEEVRLVIINPYTFE